MSRNIPAGVTVAPPHFSKNNSKCIKSQIRVRYLWDGRWDTYKHRGDPGVFGTNFASKAIRWTKHEVWISKNGRTYWGGITLRH